MHESNAAILKELHELRSRLAELEQRQRRPSSWRTRTRTWVVVATVAVTGLAGIALAASPVCANGIPFCFQANAPAQASEVNTNFAQLKTWLEAKTGATGTVASPSNSITTGSITASGLTTTAGLTTSNDVRVNNARIIGTNSAGNFHLDTTSNAMYLNWFSGSGGVVFGNGAQGQAGKIDSAGNLNLTGSVISSGYDISCATGTSGTHFGFCCRMNLRNGATQCKNGTSTDFSGWSTAAAPFVAGTEGRYSLDCAGLSGGANFPVCCRTDINGATSCVTSISGGALVWQATAAPW